MSDVMLFGVLRMPYEFVMSSEMSRLQFHCGAQRAADRIEADGKRIAELEAECEALSRLNTTLDEKLVELEAALAKAQEDARKWISVDDRLPQPETDVLVLCLRHGEEAFDVAGLFHGEWASAATERNTKGEVTHWMPLPAAPTPDSEQT